MLEFIYFANGFRVDSQDGEDSSNVAAGCQHTISVVTWGGGAWEYA